MKWFLLVAIMSSHGGTPTFFNLIYANKDGEGGCETAKVLVMKNKTLGVTVWANCIPAPQG